MDQSSVGKMITDQMITDQMITDQMITDQLSAEHGSIFEILSSVVSAAGFSLFDFQPAIGNRGVLKVFVFRKDREAPLPSLDDCSEIARNLLDHPLVEQLMPGESTLEVSTPGVNRHLKTLEHFNGAVGERIRVKWRRQDLNASPTSTTAVNRPAPVSEVDLGVVSEVIAAGAADNNPAEGDNAANGDNTGSSQTAPLIVLKREISRKKGKKQRKKRSSLDDSEVVQSDGSVGGRSEDATTLTVRIPLDCILEAHVDFDFR